MLKPFFIPRNGQRVHRIKSCFLHVFLTCTRSTLLRQKKCEKHEFKLWTLFFTFSHVMLFIMSVHALLHSISNSTYLYPPPHIPWRPQLGLSPVSMPEATDDKFLHSPDRISLSWHPIFLITYTTTLLALRNTALEALHWRKKMQENFMQCIVVQYFILNKPLQPFQNWFVWKTMS